MNVNLGAPDNKVRKFIFFIDFLENMFYFLPFLSFFFVYFRLYSLKYIYIFVKNFKIKGNSYPVTFLTLPGSKSRNARSAFFISVEGNEVKLAVQIVFYVHLWNVHNHKKFVRAYKCHFAFLQIFIRQFALKLNMHARIRGCFGNFTWPF